MTDKEKLDYIVGLLYDFYENEQVFEDCSDFSGVYMTEKGVQLENDIIRFMEDEREG